MFVASTILFYFMSLTTEIVSRVYNNLECRVILLVFIAPKLYFSILFYVCMCDVCAGMYTRCPAVSPSTLLI